jgi:hypothetical protein
MAAKQSSCDTSQCSETVTELIWLSLMMPHLSEVFVLPYFANQNRVNDVLGDLSDLSA